jgi:Leucine-rich repeat (LRR) protein
MSELALRLIAKNKKTRETFLDLGNCGLTEVPAELGELVWLEELSFASGWRDGGEWKDSANNGPANRLQRLMPTLSFGGWCRRWWDNSPAENPFAALIRLRRLSLRGDYSNPFKLSDLSPLTSLAQLQSLDVSNTQVADLIPLSDLAQLRELDVRYAKVADLTPLAGLSQLQSLNVSEMPIDDLTPLAGLVQLQSLDISATPVADLTPLAGLIQLQSLNVSETPIADLTPLAGLNQLQRLFVSSTPVADLTPLAGLNQLQRLHVSNTSVVDLAPLSGLVQLQLLNLSDTPVADLLPLSGLARLQKLDASNTEISDLAPLLPLLRQGIPASCRYGLLLSRGIFVKDCPLTHPPVEVVQQGNAAILNYFQESAAQGVDHLYEAKLLIVGEGGAGKTSLLRRLYQPEQPLPEECDTTKGIDIHRHDFTLDNGRRFRLNVWDFGGQEIYHATHQFFLTKRSLYVLLDDTRKDHKSVQDEGFKYWLEAVDQLSEHSPLLIFQNEKGGRSKAIDTAGIKGRFPSVKEVYRGRAIASSHIQQTEQFLPIGVVPTRL